MSAHEEISSFNTVTDEGFAAPDMNLDAIDEANVALFWRPKGEGSVHFTDTVSSPQDPNKIGSWRRIDDYDARATIVAESDGVDTLSLHVPIGEQPHIASPGTVLIDDLVRSRNQRADETRQDIQKGKTPHPDALKELERSSYGTVVVANFAERSDETVANGHNGRNFYVAVTDAGTEIYATPLKFLRGLEDRNRILGLYQVPEDNSVYDATEQFRSGRVATIRRYSEELEPIFQYRSRQDLIVAKEAGNHPSVIPEETRNGHITHIDKYGNIRGELKDISVLTKLMKHAMGETVQLMVSSPSPDEPHNTFEQSFDVVVGENLKTAPDRERLSVYTNGADHFDEGSTVGFFEIMARVKNPNTSENTAIYQLLRNMPPNFLQNIGAVELSLRA